MADPKRLEQLASKLDQLVKVSSFLSGFNNLNSIDMSDSEIANFETQLKLMDEMATTLNEISFEIRSAAWEGRMILNVAKSVRNQTEGDKDNE